MADGQVAHVCMGPTIDEQLLRYLFGATEQAAKILNVDADFQTELAAKRARLAPTRIGSDGRLMEWLEEYGEPEPQHRHTSHLWGLYPGNEIDPITTPDLAAAARKSLDARGDAGTGWGLAFKMAHWTRLGDGDHACKLLVQQLNPIPSTGRTTGGGTYPNLFDGHPPFQIDGNFGATAAIVEMLLQSQSSEIHLLPSLPGAWPNGEVRGLRARGGVEVESIRWTDGKLQQAILHSTLGGPMKVRLGQTVVELQLNPQQSVRLDGSLRRL
jgi:alpha-L-fucosidase 2